MFFRDVLRAYNKCSTAPKRHSSPAGARVAAEYLGTTALPTQYDLELLTPFVRELTAIGTVGMSNLVWKKSEGTMRTKTKAGELARCHNSGKSRKEKPNPFTPIDEACLQG